MRYLWLFVLVFLNVSYAYEYDTEPITECWKEGDIIDFSGFDEPDEPAFFTADQCNANEKFTSERNFFAAYGAPEMTKINEVLQQKLDPLWNDHQGHNHATIGAAAEALRTYNFCLESLCDLIARDCGGHNQVGDWEKNLERCDQRHQKLLGLTQTKVDVLLEGNTARKSRSLFIESASRIGYHFDQFLHDRLANFNLGLQTAEQAILALTKLTW